MKELPRLSVLFARLLSVALLLSSCGTADTVRAPVPASTANSQASMVMQSAVPNGVTPNDLILELQTRLQQQQVPIKTITITNLQPLQIAVTLQSTSTNDKIVPGDAYALGTTDREVNALRRHHVANTVAYVTTTVLNQHGQTIVTYGIPFDQMRDTAPIVPSKVDNNVVEQAIRNKVIPPNGIVLKTVDVQSNTDNNHLISIKLAVQTGGSANDALSIITATLPKIIQQLRNDQGAEIASYGVELVDTNNQPLLVYVRSYLGTEEHQQWWQAPELSQDWFPHPDAAVPYDTPVPSPIATIEIRPTSNPYPAPAVPVASPTSTSP